MENPIAGVDVASGSATIRLTRFRNLPAAVQVWSTTACSVNCCYFENCVWGVNNLSATLVDATTCWWGSPSGPGLIGPGSGANVSSNVLYDPWLSDSSSGSPLITQPPADVPNAVVGQLVSFSVAAGGAQLLSYQWRRDGNNLTDVGRISGATTATLIIDTVTLSDAGRYDVAITTTCGSGTAPRRR